MELIRKIKGILHRQKHEEAPHDTETAEGGAKTADKFNLKRFLEAQSVGYIQAVKEMSGGHKRTHWIWYVFPQLSGLGHSYNSRYYAISCREEAEAYLAHPVLGERLRTVTAALLAHADKSAEEIFGGIDAMKVRSCMTLFDSVSPHDIFRRAIDTFYEGHADPCTLKRL